jgi:hypothetical protein
MAETDNLVLEHLRAIRTDLGEVGEDLREVKRRLTSLEVSVANLHGDFAGQSGRIDRVENRLDLRDA